MKLIEWNDSLSVRIGEIDRQHRQLIDLINELSEAMSEGKGRATVGRILDGLLQYTETHFQTEERYFDRFAYPMANSHKKEHAAFVAKVTEFRDAHTKGRLALSIDVMNFLKDWLRNHIKGVDMEYSPFLRERGLR